MLIRLKNKHTLIVDDFYFKCCVGKKGITLNKKEGDNKTPIGTFRIGNLYYRKDKILKPETKLKCIKIKKNMGWCNDVKKEKYYNKFININKRIRHEKLFRHDYKYDLFVPIKYNYNKPITGRGNCIFIHLTKDFLPTAGCVGLKKKDFLIMLKLINRNSKIQIY